jgi:hypothetical protein
LETRSGGGLHRAAVFALFLVPRIDAIDGIAKAAR